jgi:hydroxyacylglutathione hydrolase
VLIAGFPSALTDTNCWVVAPGDGEQCVIIDPGIEVEARLNDVIAQRRLHPVAVLLTHGHLDHVFSVLPVCTARDVPAYIHPNDRSQLGDPWTAMGMVPGTPIMGLSGLTFAEPSDVREFADDEQVALAGLNFHVVSTPGHTRGSVVFGTNGVDGAEGPTLFSGDVLFAGSIGRVDLPGGSMTEMLNSLRDVILPMDDETVVHPGHGPSTSIGIERASNPYLRGLA